VALSDGDAGVSVDSRSQGQAGLEPLGRQGPQQAGLERVVLPHAHRAVADPAGVITVVVAGQELVELGHRLDLGDRHQVVAAEPAALPLDPALLMGALHTGLAVERLEAVFTELRLSRGVRRLWSLWSGGRRCGGSWEVDDG
jgi:hypothetical protein